MTTDLRTELNDCDNATGFTGDGQTPGVTTLTGQFYEGTGSIFTQHSNADEQMNTTQTSGGGGTFSLDLSDSTVYLLAKDNLVDTYANGGVQMVLGDGTDLIGYDVGGNDAVGLPLNPFYNTYKLDVSEAAATPGGNNAYTGSEAALNHAAISAIGFGSLHLAKAQGNVSNVFIDSIKYIANGSYALRINGGTVGTPETMADVKGDDVTNGWGVVNNPLGAQYGFFAPVEWGEPTANADSYFEAIDEQWFFIGDNAGGRAVGAGNFLFRVVGNATDTISFELTNVTIINTGSRAAFDFSDTNVNILNLTGVTFTGFGEITFPPNSATKDLVRMTFNDCGIVDLNTIDVDRIIFNGGSDALGSVLFDTAGDSDLIDTAAFTSDGTGHAIYITATGTYDFNLFTYSGYASVDGVTGNEVVYNNSGGAITINVLGGDTPTVRNGAGASTTLVVNPVTTLVAILDETGADLENARVRIEADTGGPLSVGTVIISGLTDVNGEISDTRSLASDQPIIGIVRKATEPGTLYQQANIVGTISNTAGFAATISLIPDE